MRRETLSLYTLGELSTFLKSRVPFEHSRPHGIRDGLDPFHYAILAILLACYMCTKLH